MRIIGGKWRGKLLAAPENMNIRPTTDRVKENLFNILQHHYLDHLQNAYVLDLFAGTGALGLEALSRGARFVTFVEQDATARGLIRSNIESMGAMGSSRILRRDATDLGNVGQLAVADLIFLDPPYGKKLGEKALQSAWDGGWISANCLIILEEEKNTHPQLSDDFMIEDIRPYGQTSLYIIRPRILS